jgi:glutaredoxin-like protein NrdH
MSKRFLDSNNIEYTTVDIEKTPSAIDRIRELGYAALPVIETDTAHWTGYKPDLLGTLV